MIRFSVNGTAVESDAPADEPLLWVLRDDLGLVGTRYGCGGGFCGSCTVMLDGAAVRSCQLPVRAAEGREVRTIEGPIEEDSALRHVRDAFLEHQVAQCGWCMSGWQMALAARLESDPGVADDALLTGLDANLCRCGSYTRLRRAALDAAARVRGDAPAGSGA